MMPDLPATVPLSEYVMVADALACAPVIIHALSCIESLEVPCAIRRENHWWRKTRFASREAKAFDNRPNAKRMEDRWGEFRQMDAICEADALLQPRARDAAILSHSIGWQQIMGFNHKFCGFEDPRVWLAAMQTVDGQRECMIAFVRENATLHRAFQTLNYPVVAHHWNGPAYAQNKYDTKLAAQVRKLEAEKPSYV